MIDLDSSLMYCAHHLGLSRLPVIAEGITDPDLMPSAQWIDKRDTRTGLHLLERYTGKAHLQQLILLGAYYAFQPDNFHRYKDSVLFYLNKAIKESKDLNERQLGWQARLLIAKMYVDGYDFRDGDPLFDQLIKECRTTSDRVMEVKVLYYRGLYTAFTPETTPKRIEYLQQARKLYHQFNYPEGEISSLAHISYLDVPSFQLDRGYKASLEALSIAESIHFPFTQYNADAVAMLTLFEGKFGEPLRYALESAHTSEAAHDSIGLGTFYGRIGGLYTMENLKHEEAPKWLEKSVYTLMRTGVYNGLYLNLYNLIASLAATGNLNKAWAILLKVSKKMPPKSLTDKLYYNLDYVMCYTDFKKYDMAEKHLIIADSAEKQVKKNGFQFRRSLVAANFGRLYFLKGDYVKARFFYERSLFDLYGSAFGGGLLSYTI